MSDSIFTCIMKCSVFCLVGLLFPLSLTAQSFPHLAFQKFFDNRGEDTPGKILKNPDGSLLIGGTTVVRDSTGEMASVWIIKTDSAGEMIWDREVSMSGYHTFRDMALADDGGVVFAGVTNTLIDHPERGDETFGGDYFVGKLDSTGMVEWLQGMGGSSLDQAFCISRGIYREFMIAGSSHSNDGEVSHNYGMSDIWLLKIDTNGKLRHSQVLGGNQNDWATSLITCQNGDYLLAGFTNSDGMGTEKLGAFGNGLLIRISQQGSVQWQRTFACPMGGYFYDLAEKPDGNILLAGSWGTAGQGQQFWWMQLSAAGDRIIEKVIEGPGDETLTSIVPCADGGAIMGGYAQTEWQQTPYAKGGEDFWLIRTNAKGRILWQNTYGGPDSERCADLLEYRPGIYYAIGEKENTFQDDGRHRGKDFWLLRIEEYPCKTIEPGIFVRAKDFRVDRDKPVRFRARYQYGDRFFWDFGDGTTSTEEQPLKTFTLPGQYPIRLTVYANESCQQTVQLEKMLEVW